MANIGFESIEIAVLNEDETVKEIHLIDKKDGGAVEGAVSGLGAEMIKVSASNGIYYAAAKGVGEPELSLTIADIPEKVLIAITGADATEGFIKLGDKTEAPYCAVIMKTAGMKNDDIYVSLLKGKFAYPEESMNGETGSEPTKDEITMTGVTRKKDGFVYAKGRTSNETFVLDTFKAFAFTQPAPILP